MFYVKLATYMRGIFLHPIMANYVKAWDAKERVLVRPTSGGVKVWELRGRFAQDSRTAEGEFLAVRFFTSIARFQ